MRSMPDAPLACALALACGAVAAQPVPLSGARVMLVVQSTRLAGFAHYEAASVWDALREGDALVLHREPENPHDPNAVRVEWRGHMLGYVPRRNNAALAWALDRGQALHARIVQLRAHPNPARRIVFEVTLE
ncbi:MAG: HIRAN domain-containing protein [Burkholderiales bacterium]